MKTTLITFLIMFMFGNHSYAQNRMTAHVGVGVPIGEFGEGDEYFGYIKNTSYAGNGLAIGLTYQYPLGDQGLYAFGDVSIARNALRRRYRREYAEWAEEDMSINHSEYYNIPLQIGAMYQRNVEENIAVYLRGGILLNFLKITKTRTTTESGSGDLIRERRYAMRSAIGASFETGVVISDKVQIGLGITRHGRFRIGEDQYTFVPNGIEETGYSEATKNVTMLNLKVGYRF
ncbi:MAG: hypothetical protein Crog4KO_19010 [Crocinitomicaceae bacterium]